VLSELNETRDHQSLAICHYTIFPTAVFNNNPNHLQLFRAVPIAVDRTRFEVWELWYPGGDQDYLDKVGAHWERLKKVVEEDVYIYQEWAAASRSTAYTRNVFNNRECKITNFHRVVQDMLDADD
jgi:phenylpropionate dioxygenase-like ring-hydroxylating dioxygenase large terminal subunit